MYTVCGIGLPCNAASVLIHCTSADNIDWIMGFFIAQVLYGGGFIFLILLLTGRVILISSQGRLCLFGRVDMGDIILCILDSI